MTAISRRSALFAIAASALGPIGSAAARAGDIDDPATDVLSVSDASGRSAHYSRQDLAALKQTRFETKAPWIEEPAVVEGPSVAELLRAFAPRASYEAIAITALDDYLVKADVAQIVADDAVLAIRQGGAFLPVSKKGPAFLIFPFDDRPDLADKPHFGLCIWQIARITLS
ncbi:hypothetical protein [Jiella sonneratiae]|uniref:Oxidoreductase molybdopterin-binding domain-containing protein n=1 Tax=Jiella sonneratiae TaxID=2816856 RepID=A0ABS3J7L3_9HYPH|nr:hypothetical protein [Jiella sonneratiae]MBO0905654.1 hypothetical protein [Jiella sonneratiae]